MLKIRLQRVARKHIPIFRVVLTDSRNGTKSGKAHEVLGTYNLMTDEKKVNAERVKYWISKGAQPSGTLHNFLVGANIISGKKINVLPKKRPIVKKEEKKEENPPTPKVADGQGAAALEAKAAAVPTEPAVESAPAVTE